MSFNTDTVQVPFSMCKGYITSISYLSKNNRTRGSRLRSSKTTILSTPWATKEADDTQLHQWFVISLSSGWVRHKILLPLQPLGKTGAQSSCAFPSAGMRRHTAAHFLSQEEWGYRWRVGEPAHTAREGHLDQLDHWQTTWLSCLSMVNVRRPELKYHPASLLQFCKTFRGKDALMVWRFRTFGFLCFSACCCNRWAIGTGAWRRDDDPSGHAGSWRGALGRGGIRGSGYFIHVRLLIVAIVANSPY